ncbi:MAG: DMT family transporter [Saprospiraceae bacterium]|jgi:drug/metabolite transporter (DMT)-like permease|nr:DMT family transporter [Saprospiraceae bacterium]MDP4999347.1 DMT family transporter [Saprospiraceae bacterium]
MKTFLRAAQTNTFVTGALLVLLGSVLVSTKAILVKLAYQYDIGMIALLSLRMLFSLPVFVLIAYRSWNRQKGKLEGLTRKDWFKIALIGVMGYYLASMFDFLGLQYITAGLERLILFVYPTLVVLIVAFAGKKPIPGFQVKALLLTYLGILLAFLENVLNNSSENILLGTVLVFGCALFYALYIVGSSYYVAKTGSWLFTSIAMIAASGAVFLHQLTAGDQALGQFDWQVYALALTMSIIATILPTFMISEGIRLVGASNAAIIGSVGPISTIILAYIFLGEQLGWIQIVGTGLVVAGVLAISLQKTT